MSGQQREIQSDQDKGDKCIREAQMDDEPGEGDRAMDGWTESGWTPTSDNNASDNDASDDNASDDNAFSREQSTRRRTNSERGDADLRRDPTQCPRRVPPAQQPKDRRCGTARGRYEDASTETVTQDNYAEMKDGRGKNKTHDASFRSRGSDSMTAPEGSSSSTATRRTTGAEPSSSARTWP